MNRRLNLESLEHRLLLAADVAFQNPLLYQDVNFDSHVSQVDALQVINHLNYPELYDVDAPVGAFLDVSGDNAASAIDALQIINELNGTEQTNEALFEQVETFAGEVELMQELLPEDIESLGQNLLLRVQEQADEIADMREQLEEFLQTPPALTMSRRRCANGPAAHRRRRASEPHRLAKAQDDEDLLGPGRARPR